MKVFISWSGDVSKQLAEALSKWLPRTLQYVKPYFSPDDIEKGAKWDDEISGELKASKVCIVALTPQCLDSKWIMFEAGAISASHDRARICAILFGIEPINVQGPLQRFQATVFSKTDIRRLVETINLNADADRMLAKEVLDDVFEQQWPRLEGSVTKILQAAASAPATERGERSLLQEAVSLGRSIQVEQRELHETVYSIRTLLSNMPTYNFASGLRDFITAASPALSGSSLGTTGGLLGKALTEPSEPPAPKRGLV